MKKIILLLVASSFLIVAQAQPINDPNVELRTASGYHGIEAGDAFDIYITQGEKEGVAVSASAIKYRDRIKVDVKNGILRIRYDRDNILSLGNDKKKLKAYVSVKHIEQLDISGACNVYILGALKADVLSIRQSGASDLKGRLEVGKLAVDLSGASDMTMTGTAIQMIIEASGASKFKGYELVAEICSAEASGASDIEITVNKELSADASGASDVRYKGNGVIRDVKSSGAGKVVKKG